MSHVIKLFDIFECVKTGTFVDDNNNSFVVNASEEIEIRCITHGPVTGLNTLLKCYHQATNNYFSAFESTFLDPSLFKYSRNDAQVFVSPPDPAPTPPLHEIPKAKVCTCGADKTKVYPHSSWCDK